MNMRFPWPAPGGKKARLRVGIDIGLSAVKILRVEVARDRTARALEPVIEAVPEPTPAAQKAALQRAIVAANLPPGADVRLSMAGQDIMTRCLTLPAMTATELDGAIRFEGETYLPFPINDVVIDKQILESLNGNKMRVLLVAGKRDTIQAHVAWIQECGLRPALVDVDALAVVNAYVADQEGPPPPLTTALVHIGVRFTNVAILQRGQLCCFTRDLTIAGQDLTKTIAEQLGVPPTEAEQLKFQPGERGDDVNRAVHAALELLANELRLSLDFYESQFEGGVERMVLTGGTSLVPLVPPFLKEQLNLPIEPWTPQRWLTRHGLQVSKDVAARLAVCVGLASREDL